ncbi:MAG: molybdenum cofactor guanylyltransferase [Actinomycetota bacterium]
MTPDTPDRVGAVVLAGGSSRRMGVSKATLDWGGRPLVCHVSALLAASVGGPVVVAAAPDQELPRLPDGVRVTRDSCADRGPLEGLAAGMLALIDEVDLVFVSTVDAPLLNPELVSLLLRSLRVQDQIAVPIVGSQSYPLTAVWRLTALAAIRRSLETDRLRVKDLLEQCVTRFIDEEQLRAVDPNLDSLRNLNDPDAYREAVRVVGGRSSL